MNVNCLRLCLDWKKACDHQKSELSEHLSDRKNGDRGWHQLWDTPWSAWHHLVMWFPVAGSDGVWWPGSSLLFFWSQYDAVRALHIGNLHGLVLRNKFLDQLWSPAGSLRSSTSVWKMNQALFCGGNWAGGNDWWPSVIAAEVGRWRHLKCVPEHERH